MFVIAFLIAPVCEPVQQATAEASQRFEILLEGNEIGSIMLAWGTAVFTDQEHETFNVSWIAYSQRGGKEITWYINARKARNGPLVPLSETILERIRKTVDLDGANQKPWKAEVTTGNETGAPVNIVHTSINWAKRFCTEEKAANPPKMTCDAVATILDVPIRTFRASSFVKAWEVKGYHPRD
jgi:hypothetical protein